MTKRKCTHFKLLGTLNDTTNIEDRNKTSEQGIQRTGNHYTTIYSKTGYSQLAKKKIPDY